MPRQYFGPRLVPTRNPGWPRTILYVHWRDETGRHKKATPLDATSSQDARNEFLADWIAQQQREQRRRDGRPAQPYEVRVVDVLNDYAEEHGKGIISAKNLLWMILPLVHFFEYDTIHTLTNNRVKEYWEWRGRTRIETTKGPDGTIESVSAVPGTTSNGTIIRELGGVLRPAIKHAVGNRRLVQGVYQVKVPRAPPIDHTNWLTPSQVTRLMWESRRDSRSRLHFPLFLQIAYYTGERLSAILDLTWDQVDTIRGRIDFNPPGRIQTDKRRPLIPIPRQLLAALKRAKRRRGVSPYVLTYKGKKISSIKTAFNSAAARAGVEWATPNTLRHTAATWMMQDAVPEKDIARYLGHLSDDMTATTGRYLHAHPDYLTRAKLALERHGNRDLAAELRAEEEAQRQASSEIKYT